MKFDPDYAGSYPYAAERYRDGEWHRTAQFMTRNLDAVGKHAAALGGDVRLVRRRDGAVLATWRDGELVRRRA